MSFGDYIRAVARQQKQDSESRPVLQNIGESLIAQGWPAFCRNVLATISWQPGNPAVIDGIRHVEAVDNLRAIVVPLGFVLVHVKIDDDRQLHRVRLEQGTLESLGGLELHSTEADVKSRLPELADLLVDGARPIEERSRALVFSRTSALWPRPMNQRIADAMKSAGYAPVEVTATVERLLGPIW